MRKVAVCGRRMRPAAPPPLLAFPRGCLGGVGRWTAGGGAGGGERNGNRKRKRRAQVNRFSLQSGGLSGASRCPRARPRSAPRRLPPPRPAAGSEREREREGGRASGERAAASRGRGSCPPRRRPRSVEVLPAPRRLARPRPCSAAAMSDKEFMWALKNGDLDEVKDYVAKVGGGGEGLGWARRRWGEGGDVQRAPSVRGSAGWGRAWGRTVGFPRR